MARPPDEDQRNLGTGVSRVALAPDLWREPEPVVTNQISEADARALTDEVNRDIQALWGKLLELYERGAHTALGYSSWGEYFEAEFEGKKSRSYQLLDSGRVLRELANSTIVERPSNEAQARELAPLLDQPEQLREAWSDAVEKTGGAPTARDVRAARLSLVETETVDTPSTVEDLTAGLTDRQRHIADKNKERIWNFMGGLSFQGNRVRKSLDQAFKTATGPEIKAWTRELYAFEKTSRELRSVMKSELDARIAAWERELHSASGNQEEERDG